MTRIDRRDVIFGLAAATAWVAIVRPGPLSLPYFWDEADVYVPGSIWLAEHGFDITPGVFDDDYSRGHPPLLYLWAAIAFRIFGSAPIVGHLAVVPFTVLAIAGTYWLGTTLFDRYAGAIAAALLASTPLFMSIGNMLLPEVPLTALSVLALFAFARGKLGIAVVLGVAMVWVKETGIFSAAAIGVGVLVQARQEKRWKASEIAAATIPLFALLAFFAWQRASAGYFVFPHHQNLFADRPLEWGNVLTVWPSLVILNGRFIATLGAVLAIALGASHDRSRTPAIAACVALVLFNAVFFTKMFWLERYALPAHPCVLVCAAGALRIGFSRLGRARAGIVAAIAIATFAVGLASMWAPAPRDSEELTFAYADVIETHERAFARMSEEDAPVLTSWPMTVELERPGLGYVDRPIETIDSAYAGDAAFGSILVNDASGRADSLRALARERNFELAFRTREGSAPELELYRPAR